MMAAGGVDTDKYSRDTLSPLVEAALSLMRDMARSKIAAAGGWDRFLVDDAREWIDAAAVETVEQQILASGYRFDWSAGVSVAERPDAYKGGPGRDGDPEFSFDHPEAPHDEPEVDGRTLVGVGDNVVSHPANRIGIARYVRSNERVLSYLTDGTPADTIAIIDDSGGTLTAPILEGFAGVICAGGTVRSHLGILTREYGIPCLMNARIADIREGDQVEIEVTATAKTTEDYQEGRNVVGRVWRLQR